MKILLLNPPDPPRMNIYRDFIGGFGSVARSRRARYGHDILVIPPVFLAYAAAMLEKSGFEVSILDGQVQDLGLPQLVKEVEKRNPEVVVSRVCLPSFEEDLRIMTHIKEVLPNTFLIGWGTICKVKPQESLMKSELELVIRDELEFTLLDVIKKLERKESMHSVKGVSFRSGGEIIHNPKRPIVKDLDSLPLPACHLLDMEKYVAKGSQFFPDFPETEPVRFFSMVSSRGCSFNCLYCGHPIAFGPWRGMSPERTVDEIEYLVNKYKVQGIWFLDAAFSMSVKRAMRICDGILERGLNFRWICQAQAVNLPKDLVKKMKKAGCIRVEIGVETGDPELLSKYKRGCTTETIEQAFRITRQEGIRRLAFLMVGLPGESWETIRNTRKLIKKLHPDGLSVSITTPYPGTPLYEMAKRNNWLVTENWKKYNQLDPVMSLPGFTEEDMRKARLYLRDQMFEKEINERTRALFTAIRDRSFRAVAKEVIRMFLDLPKMGMYVYNVIRCRLKEDVA